jgi:tRNA threonylcarbamoyladenosine biosynthesis protein TsaB
MRILAIETIDLSGSVAALEGEQTLAELRLNSAMRSAQSLAPAIADLLRTVQWQPEHVKLVAVATGPGSFTGLRVGMTTAKMFAYAVKAEVMGVHTMEAIACQANAKSNQLWTVLDAQREQVFASRFRRDADGSMQWMNVSPAQPSNGDLGAPSGATTLLTNEAWLGGLSADCAVSGPGLVKLQARLPSGVEVVNQVLWSPQAATIGQLARKQYAGGQRDSLAALVPQYFRPSAAEEKRAAAG